MKNNLRYAQFCLNCKYFISDYDYHTYCNLDNSCPENWQKSENEEWRKSHFVGDYSVCDNFEEEI